MPWKIGEDLTKKECSVDEININEKQTSDQKDDKLKRKLTPR